jgi:hypothetical protein
VAATPGDPRDDDAVAINAAMQAAMDHIESHSFDDRTFTFQQLIYLPPGTYHLESPVVAPLFHYHSTVIHPTWRANIERLIWLYGEGTDRTVLELKSAQEAGIFGSARNPLPVVQLAPYTYGPEGEGNWNSQLWATGFSIVVPRDQPHAIGLSYGCANIGGIRNLCIRAEGDAGHTGLALVQYNNGPAWIEHVRVEGFDTGIEISDGWGEIFGLSDIEIVNQNRGGVGISLADKQIALENLTIREDRKDVLPIRLFDDTACNSPYGGAPHLILLHAEITCTDAAIVPAILIDKGHSYIRDLRTSGYGEDMILDHGTSRFFPGGRIENEYISVHGHTPQEKDNVAVAIHAPGESISLPVEPAPEIDPGVFSLFSKGDYMVVDQVWLESDPPKVSTSWVIVDPTASDDDTQLLQAALNSGARYVGISNSEPLTISETIVINGGPGKNVELLFGYMSEIYVSEEISLRKSPDIPNDQTLLQIETGNEEELFIKGLRVTAEGGFTSCDYLLFLNNSSKTVIFEDICCEEAPRHYRNGRAARGGKVFFENVEFVYDGIFHDDLVVFEDQRVWARQLNVESPLYPAPVEYAGKMYSKKTTRSKVLNRGSELWVLLQKLGEHNGIFVQTEQGGKTEMLSVYFNPARVNTDPKITHFLVKDPGSEFSMVGQERIRTGFDENGIATSPLPHGNKFGVYITGEGMKTIKATSLPTYLTYEGTDPFTDTDSTRYDQRNHFRVAGMLRVAIPGSIERH